MLNTSTGAGSPTQSDHLVAGTDVTEFALDEGVRVPYGLGVKWWAKVSCTANVLVGSSSLGHHRIRGLQILETSPWETFPWLNSALILSK